MLTEKKSLLINDLQVGMISASNITFENKVLLADGLAITESILERLRYTYIIDRVDVYLDTDPSEALSSKSKTVDEIEHIFSEFSINLESIFDVMTKLRSPEIDEIRVFSKKIQDELHSIGPIIKDVIFYGSEKDSIYRHSVNVTAISFILGTWLGFDEKELNLLTYAALLHDFGKIKLNKLFVHKNGHLSDSDYEILKTHSQIGYNYVKQIPFLDSSVSHAILTHHETADGAGYPLHITGNKIPKFARIIAIADLFDEVSSNRYSKKINGPFDALKVIQEEGLRKLDSEYCNTFLLHIVNYYMGENVLLNNNQSYKVIQVKIDDLLNPLLLGDDGFLDLTKEHELYVEKLVI